MLLGQSVFQSVLTRLKEERVEDDIGETGASFRIQGLGLGFVAATEDLTDIGTGTEAYFAFFADEEESRSEQHVKPEPMISTPKSEPLPSEPEIPPHLLRLSEAEIAAELSITDKDTELTLTEKRRRFAKANHPDSVPEALRENAGTRMKTANLLIDTAIKNLFWR